MTSCFLATLSNNHLWQQLLEPSHRIGNMIGNIGW